MHRRQRIGHSDAGDVICGAREGVDSHDHHQWGAAAKHRDGVQVVLQVAVIPTRQEVERGEDDREHHECTPHAFEANDLQTRQVDLLEQPLLRHDLRRSHHLTSKSQRHTQEEQRSITFLAVVRLARPPHARQADEDDAKYAQHNPKPMEAEELPSQEDHSEEGSKDHLCATQQLPDAGRNVQEAHGAQACGKDVEHSRSCHPLHLRLPSHALRTPTLRWTAVDECCSQRGLLRSPQVPVEWQCRHHGEEHDACDKPRLRKVTAVAFEVGALHCERYLQHDGVQRPTCHQTEDGHSRVTLTCRHEVDASSR
mmetsp:Transcript_75399/g.218976  ORF Transcript_75399/g.218976 Transcript_75399/m.218976 type:complete len:311 (-) Transcript_75399:58-990(-)